MKQFKSLICLILALMLCLSLCACSVDTDAIDDELQGTWENLDGSAVYTFLDGWFSCKIVVPGMSMEPREGEYKITADAIELHYDNGVDAQLEYSFDDGELSLEDLYKKPNRTSNSNAEASLPSISPSN